MQHEKYIALYVILPSIQSPMKISWSQGACQQESTSSNNREKYQQNTSKFNIYNSILEQYKIKQKFS